MKTLLYLEVAASFTRVLDVHIGFERGFARRAEKVIFQEIERLPSSIIDLEPQERPA